MDENSFYQARGQGTEVSLIKWLQQAEIPVHKIMAMRDGHIRAQVPFDNKLKRSIIAVQIPTMENTVRIYVKGAPENVLQNCNSYFNDEGLKMPFSDDCDADTILETMKT